MTLKDKYNRQTDQAWNHVYNRLEKDGLVTDKEAIHPPRRITVLKWTAAAAILLCLYLSVDLLFNQADKKAVQNLLTQKNTETTTLVTTLEDGSIVYLAGDASIHYPEHFPADKREVSLKGNALFDITGNRQRPFVIETDEVKIEVLGTAFNVKSNDNKPFELSVQRGTVKVTLKKSGQDVYVKAGQTATILSQKLHVDRTRDMDQFSQYIQQIRFKDERIGDILRIINMNSSEIQLRADPSLENRMLTVTFSENSPKAMAELICLAFNLKCTRSNNIISLSENK